ncbi:hypothetical protein [Ensifer oleiphilus]|uniref:hypothetical protein n=1 Tax=Ensifer oleiphilus TaxID=2742698 RepID=UPI003CCEC5C9
MIDDRINRMLIPRPGLCQPPHIAEYRLHFGDLALKLSHLLKSDLLGIRACPAVILLEMDEPLDVFDQKPKVPCLPNETERAEISPAIDTVTGQRSRCGRDKADAFVVPNHFDRKACFFRRFTNVHRALLPNAWHADHWIARLCRFQRLEGQEKKSARVPESEKDFPEPGGALVIKRSKQE